MFLKPLRVIKPEIRVLGVDDGQFTPHSKEQVPVVGVVFRGGCWFDGFMQTTVTVDGFDATERIIDMVVGSPHFRQLRVIVLNGITFGGFNVVDIQLLSEETGLPVLAVTQRKPDLVEVRKAIDHLPEAEARWNTILKAGEVFSVLAGRGKEKVFVEVAGISVELAEKVLRLTSTRSNVPEPLRVAHLIASGLRLNTGDVDTK